MSSDRFMDKIKDILVLLFTRCDCRPDSLAPAHAGLAASTLCDPSINHHGAHLTFRTIIRRLDARFRQKSEIIGCRIALKPFGQLFRQLMIRRSSHLLQKAGFNTFHRTYPTGGGQYVSPMQGTKEFFEPVQQFCSPAGQYFNAVFGQETNLTNQMSHTILNPNVKQPGKLTSPSNLVRP